MPIFYVIVEYMPQPNGYTVYKILKVVECDLSELEAVWKREVTPLTYGTGRSVTAYSFYREPDNPFRIYALQQTIEELREQLQEAQAYIENVDTTDTGYGKTYTRG